MTELQKTEFQMLCVFVDICNKLNLKYFLVCGSALGAVKYNGFIPWDDDIDIGMPRDDYEVFIENAQELLPSHMFLQNHLTDKEYPLIFSKLRNSNTTYTEIGVAHLNINQGVFIDIFPLDGYPKDAKEQNLFEKKKRWYTLNLFSALKMKRTWKYAIFNKLLRILGYHKRTFKTAEKYIKMISKYSICTSELICNHGNWQGKLEYAPKEQYGDGVFAEFEGLTVRIPEKYDEYLTQKYGDWRADLPKEQQVGHHYYEVCDVNKPYTEYINNISK